MESASILSTVQTAVNAANLGPTFLSIAGIGIGIGLVVWGVKKAVRVFKGVV